MNRLTKFICLIGFVLALAFAANSQTVPVTWAFSNIVGQSATVTRVVIQPLQPYVIGGGGYLVPPTIVFTPQNYPAITNGYVTTNIQTAILMTATVSGPGFSRVVTNYFPAYLTNSSTTNQAANYDVAGIQTYQNTLLGVFYYGSSFLGVFQAGTNILFTYSNGFVYINSTATNGGGGGGGGNSNYFNAGTGLANSTQSGATGTTNNLSVIFPTLTNNETQPTTFTGSLTADSVFYSLDYISQLASGSGHANSFNNGLWFDDGSGDLTAQNISAMGNFLPGTDSSIAWPGAGASIISQDGSGNLDLVGKAGIHLTPSGGNVTLTQGQFVGNGNGLTNLNLVGNAANLTNLPLAGLQNGTAFYVIQCNAQGVPVYTNLVIGSLTNIWLYGTNVIYSVTGGFSNTVHSSETSGAIVVTSSGTNTFQVDASGVGYGYAFLSRSNHVMNANIDTSGNITSLGPVGFTGSGSGLTGIPPSALQNNGTSPNNTVYYRGDGSWQVPPGSGGGGGATNGITNNIATLVSGQVTISTPLASTNGVFINATYYIPPGTSPTGLSFLYISNIVAGTSFVVASGNGNDTNQIIWTLTTNSGSAFSGGGGSGTVTSAGIIPDSVFVGSVSGSPITTSGNITLHAATWSADAIAIGPATGSAAPTVQQYPSVNGSNFWNVNAQSLDARMDYIIVTNGAHNGWWLTNAYWTNGVADLWCNPTNTFNGFSNNSVGENIELLNGTSTGTLELSTTIASYIAPNHVTLAATPTTTKNANGWASGGTDDTAAVQSAINTCSNNNVTSVYLGPGIWFWDGPYVNAGYGGGPCQVYLPAFGIKNNAQRTLSIIGASHQPSEIGGYSTNGTIILSTKIPSAANSAVLGGLQFPLTGTSNGSTFANIQPNLENLTFTLYPTPQGAAVGFDYADGFTWKNLVANVGQNGNSILTQPNNVYGIAFRCPAQNNATTIFGDSMRVSGFYYAATTSDHFNCTEFQTQSCLYGIWPGGSGENAGVSHDAHIGRYLEQATQVPIYCNASSGQASLTIDHYEYEHQAAVAWQQTAHDIVDASAGLKGHILSYSGLSSTGIHDSALIGVNWAQVTNLVCTPELPTGTVTNSPGINAPVGTGTFNGLASTSTNATYVLALGGYTNNVIVTPNTTLKNIRVFATVSSGSITISNAISKVSVSLLPSGFYILQPNESITSTANSMSGTIMDL